MSSKLKEALDKIGNISAFVAENCGNSDTAKYMNDIISIVQEIVAEPPRNCDVGTAEEQTERYRKFCSAHKYLASDFTYLCKGFGKGRCPFSSSHTKSQCEFAWAQMPYEKGVAK